MGAFLDLPRRAYPPLGGQFRRNCGVSPQQFYRWGLLTYNWQMNKAIIRIEKLKSPVAVRRSIQHAFRDKETPNAVAERTQDNTHFGAQSSADAMRLFNAALPEKVRTNAVLAVEYVITGSPEALHGKTREEQDAYFADSIQGSSQKTDNKAR